MRIMWFYDLKEAIDFAERLATDNGCTAKGKEGIWERFNPVCPKENAVIVREAKRYEPNGPEGFEVVIRANIYGDEKFPGWLEERGITAGTRFEVPPQEKREPYRIPLEPALREKLEKQSKERFS